VTAGADKWLKTFRWESSLACVQYLRQQGYRILVTHLKDAKPIDDFDFSIPTAIAFGNEKDGISDELLALSDGAVKIPMQGFTQSFNISVAAALSLYHIAQDRKRRLGQHGDLSEQDKLTLHAEYIWNTMGNPEAILERLLANRAPEAEVRPSI
jgi:tRNA (guanosine-2'-O-)-methyltransferase